MDSLKDKKILVTREAAKSPEFVSLLESCGAKALLFPCLNTHFEPLPNLDLNSFDWVIFTSQNAVQAFKNIRLPEHIRIATVGPKTATSMSSWPTETVENCHPGLDPGSRNVSPALDSRFRGNDNTVVSTQGHTLTPDTFDSRSLANLFTNMPPQRIFLPQSNLSDDSLQTTLESSGHTVHAFTAYRTECGSGGIDFSQHIDALDAITFTSPSAAHFFLKRGGTILDLPVACLGRTTYSAVCELGFPNVLCAKEHRLEGLVQVLEEYFL